MKIKQKPTHKTIIAITGLVLFAMVQLYPLYWLVMFSLKSNADILMSDNILGWPAVFQWQNYATVLSRSTIPRYLLNSAIYTGATVFIVGILTAMASYAVARMKWKISGIVLMVFVVGIMIPPHAALLPLFQVLEATHLRNVPYVGLTVVYVAFAIPMSMMILTSFFKAIPRELEEAALIDGCGIFGLFWRIMMPLIMPALATASIFTVMGAWNDLLMVQTFVDVNSYKTITVGVLDFVGVHSRKLGLIGAGLVTATVPVILIYMLFSEKIQQSLLEGAIKG
ncbi:MAG: carbohydrate ABC transporter permease [Clostridiales bacterium]|nr:carbohydrate ABC transporter permease [Clostridiales bacterium]